MARGPLKCSLLLTFEDDVAEENFVHFYDGYTQGTTLAANVVVIISGFALCLKAWKNQWETLLSVHMCVVPVMIAALAVLVLRSFNMRLYHRMRYALFAFFKVYGSTQANYICAALLPNKVMSALSFVTSSIFLSPLAGLTFYSLGYFMPLNRGIFLHLVATIFAVWLTSTYCGLAIQEPPAAKTALVVHQSIDAVADLMWCGVMLPAEGPKDNAAQACVHLLDMLCILLGFTCVNLLIFLSELKARVKFATHVASRNGVRYCGAVIRHPHFQGYAVYFAAGVLHFAGIAWYATGFLASRRFA